MDNRFPLELKKEMDRYIVGQEKLKRKLSVAVYKHIAYGIRDPILIIGPSGSGKTFTIEIIRKILRETIKQKNYSVMIYDYSRQTPEGISGEDVESMLDQMKCTCRNDHNPEYRGLVFIDEVDKIIMPSYTSNGNMNAAVQYQLMNILSGTTISGLDTNNLLFVLGGAFVSLDEYEASTKGKNPFGFVGKEEAVEDDADIRESLIKIGAQREFIARIRSIERICALNKNELKALLLHPQNGIIAKKTREFSKEGLVLEVEQEAAEEILEKAVQENLGARSLYNVLDKVLDEAEYYALAHDTPRIIVGKDSIINGSLPRFEKIKEQSVKLDY